QAAPRRQPTETRRPARTARSTQTTPRARSARRSTGRSTRSTATRATRRPAHDPPRPTSTRRSRSTRGSSHRARVRPVPVHVSIHDVSPRWEHEVERALSLCHTRGCKPALLVVPDFHGRWPLLGYPRFVDRLRALADDGHEIYLHGYTHLAEPAARRDLR